MFSALTKHQYDDTHPDISQPTVGGYGTGGANQYNRLAEALALDESTALQSASWGLGQNFRAAGFDSVQEMVTAMVSGEDAQLAAMAAFLKSSLLTKPLANHDWTSFARGYNGPNYAQNDYDGKLRHSYSLFSSGNAPDITVLEVQMLLIYKGMNLGQVDGRPGPATTNAILAFQAANGLPTTGEIDAGLIGALI